MKITPRLPLIALLPAALAALAAAPLAAQSVRDFQLPPGPTPSASPTPTAQGPVDPDAVVPRAPRTIATGQPSPSATPTPTPTTSPAATPVPRASSTPLPSRTPAPRTTSTPVPAPVATSPATTTQTEPSPIEPTPIPQLEPVLPSGSPELPAPPEAMSAPSPAAEESALPLPWLVGGGLLVLLAGGLGAWWWRRRETAHAAVPQIELPLVTPTPLPEEEPAPTATVPPLPAAAQPPAPTAREPATMAALAPLVEIATVTFTRSMLNLRLGYTIHVTNRGGQPIRHLRLGGELVSGHKSAGDGGVPPEDALPASQVHEIEELAPGETCELKGQLTMPLAGVEPLMQGRVPLLVPLIRWRGTGEGTQPFSRTFVLGRLPEVIGTRLLPFRLDEQPQAYHDLGVKPLD